ncbi:MAG TPA: condensation domain-containing protein [Candidatus Dormibacteraeota bacterium]|nr:condensation domain-containing protein [Candidatus Dormibacteraeota bacterium]
MPPADDGAATRLERLSPARRALAERLLAERAAARATGPARRPDPDRPAPLSFQQARAWPRERAVHHPTSLIPSTLRLGADVDMDAMERAWRRLGERHRALRTVFTAGGEQRPDGPELAFERLDLTGTPPERRDAEVERHAARLVEEPMDLAAGPPIRARLLRLAPDDHALLVAVHHLVTDAWSQLVCFRELRALYRDAGPPEPPLQYADYAAWQREAAAAGRFDAQLEHWARALAGAPPLLDLPLHPPAAADRPWDGFRLGILDLDVAAPVAAALREIGRRAGASSFMTLLAAFAAVLAATAGQDEVVVGTPAAGRTRADLEQLIGFFANPLPLRVRVDRAEGFPDLLARVRASAADAFARQDVPLDLVLRRLDLPAPPPGRAPLFQAAFVLQNVGERGARQAGAALDRRPGQPALYPFLPFYSPASAAFDVGVQLIDRGGALAGNLEYDAGRVPGEVAEALRERLLDLLARVAERPEAALARVL